MKTLFASCLLTLTFASSHAAGTACILDTLKKENLKDGQCKKQISLSKICESSLSACDKNPAMKRLKEKMPKTHVIGVVGFGNENKGESYMQTLEETVTGLNGKFHKLKTSSSTAIGTDAEKLCNQLGAYLANVAEDEKVVIIGHSKGGETALHMQGKCPAHMARVSATVPMQAVIGGSKVVDSTETKIGDWISESFGKDVTDALAEGAWGGGEGMTKFTGAASMSTRKMQELNEELLTSKRANPKKTFCVSSFADISAMPASMHKDAKKFEGAINDGLVGLSEQSDDNLCSPLLCIEGAHHKALMERDVDITPIWKKRMTDPPLVSKDCKKTFATGLLGMLSELDAESTSPKPKSNTRKKQNDGPHRKGAK